MKLGNLFKKSKKRTEQEALARELRFNEMINKLRGQDMIVERKKMEIVKNIQDAKEKGLMSEAETGKKILGQALATQKRVRGMIKNLEFALQSRELAELTKGFMDCLRDIGADIRDMVASTDVTAGRRYQKAMHDIEEQTKHLNKVLETNEIIMTEGDSESMYSNAIQEEVDYLLGETEMEDFDE